MHQSHPQSMRLDAALIKQLTGNDMITARKIYQEEITFMPVFITVINTKPLTDHYRRNVIYEWQDCSNSIQEAFYSERAGQRFKNAD